MTISRRPIEHVLKLTLFVLVVYLILRQVPMGGLSSQLKGLTLPVAFTAMALMSCRYLLMGLRWRVASGNQPIGMGWFLRNEWHILFLEMIIPIPDAEDAFRMALLRSKGLSWAQGLRSVFYLRLTGLAMLCSILITLLVLHGDHFLEVTSQWIYGLLALLILTTTFFVVPMVRCSVPMLCKIPKIGGLLGDWASFAIDEPFHTKRITSLATLSGIHFLLQAGVVHVLVIWVGAEVSFLDIFLITPLLSLSFLLPLSIQGLGLPEAALLVILPRFGVSLEAAGAVAAVHLMAYLAMIMTGGMLFMFDRDLMLSQLLKSWKDVRQ